MTVSNDSSLVLKDATKIFHQRPLHGLKVQYFDGFALIFPSRALKQKLVSLKIHLKALQFEIL